MKLIKRWTTTLGTSFDWMITQVENHEALVESSLRDMAEASATARVKLNRVRNDGLKMRKRIAELTEAEEKWKERAKKTAEEDRDKAKECLKRAIQAGKEIASLEEQVSEHRSLERQLGKDLEAIDQRINQLKQRKHQLAARECRVKTNTSFGKENIGIVSEIDEIFERWEVKLAKCESYSPESDNFESEFQNEEEDSDLEEALKDLLEDAKS